MTSSSAATSSVTPLPADRPATSAARPSTAAAPASAGALPLNQPTGAATQVITVVGSSYSSTTATLQTWTKSGSGWVAHTAPITAHLGSQGMTTSPSESKSATPVGSFTLTQAFGHNANPGSGLPYRQTNPSDWWISQSGPLYNTFQECASGCAFTQGDPNEHLYYETPFYNYAVVIDYNTQNAPGGVQQGAGSAFFLHVTDGGPTAGCVSIPQSNLISIMQWLTPSANPRILIGLG